MVLSGSGFGLAVFDPPLTLWCGTAAAGLQVPSQDSCWRDGAGCGVWHAAVVRDIDFRGVVVDGGAIKRTESANTYIPLDDAELHGVKGISYNG